MCEVGPADNSADKAITYSGIFAALYVKKINLEIYINKKGRVDIRDHVIYYTAMWSSIMTWEKPYTPREGENVRI